MDGAAEAEVVAQLLAFVDQTTDFVGVSDPWGRILYLNPAARKRLGVDDIDGLTLADLFPLEVFGFYYEVVRPQLLRTGEWSGEVLVNASATGPIPMYISTTAKLGPGGETNGGVVYARELSRIEPAAAAGMHEIDDVTGLLVAPAFDARVGRALATTRAGDETCALLVAELVGATDDLETVGALTSSSIMRALAGRMIRCARTIDVVGRVGEHQLGLLLRGVRGHADALRLGRTVYDALVDGPVTTPAGEIDVAIAYGVAVAREGDAPAALLDRALAGLAVGTRVTSRDEPAVPMRTLTLDDFQVGMSHGQVRPYAQPVVELASGAVVGYRGTPRWLHRELGMLDADAFTGMIAETSMATVIDLYIVRETAGVVVLTSRDTPLRLYASVSRRLLEDVRAEQHLTEIAEAFFLRMHQLRLQISRPLLDEWTPGVQDALDSLSDADVAFALVDVSSAGDVATFAAMGFAEVHASRSLVDAARGDVDARRSLAELVESAHEHGWIVGAPGVDDAQTDDLVRAAGVDLGWGRRYGRAEPTNTIG